MWFVGSPCACGSGSGWNWSCVFRGFVAAVEDYRCPLLLKIRVQKKKENQKRVLVLVPVLPAHQPAWILLYGTTYHYQCTMHFVRCGHLDFSLFDLQSQKAKLQNFDLNLHASCTCDHDSPSIWSPIVVPKQPRPEKLLPTQQDRAHWNLFFFYPTLQFQTRIVSTG